ncbi:MAG: PTS fructose transporter subunit EIIBC, partial [Burkholderia sp.]|nr:PTS fructose transporter subunit EIIBC [Burkholderia sp.]
MDKLIGLVSSPQQSASPMVAAQALNRAAQRRGASLAVETRSALGVQHPLNAAQIDAAHAVLIAADADERIDETPFAGKTIHRVSLDDAIREADAVLARVAANVASNTAQGGGNAHAAQGAQASPRALKIVAITSCPTGIAHTFMAAEGLAQGAKSLGHEIHVETQGSVGAQNTL